MSPVNYKKNILNRNNGFTLIEIIMVMVLLGIMGSLATMGLSTFIKNYSTAKQWTDSATAGQMAILRITKELIAISSVNASISETDETKIRFTAIHNGSDKFMKIELSGTDIILKEYSDNTTTTVNSSDLLLPNVSSFKLEYYDWTSDNNTLSGTPSTTWSEKTASCSSALTLLPSDFDKIYCKDDGGNEQKIRFPTGSINYTAPYILYYGGAEYFFCTKDGEYRASGDATGSGNCESNGWRDKIDNNIPYYDTVYIYPQSNPECFEPYTLSQKSGEECGVIGNSADNPAPTTTSTLDGTRLITVTLQIEGLNEAFTVSITPRNI